MNTIFRENIKSLESSYFAFSPRNSPTVFPEHWHTMAEFILAAKDGCHFTVNEESITLNAGEVLLVWPTELHEIISCPDSSTTVLQFDATIITECKDFNIYYHNLRNIHNLKKFSAEVNDFFCQAITDIEVLYSEPFAEPKILVKIYEMMIELCRNLQESAIAQSVYTTPSDHTFYIIKKACSFIDANCERDLSQTEVAEFCGFSTYYFSKIFHKYTLETFPEYLTKRRIAVSTQLLQNKSISIADVSYQSGFQSISNFNKLFKKNMGCTPMQYRKLYSDGAISIVNSEE